MDWDSDLEPPMLPYTASPREMFFKNVLEITAHLHDDFKETKSVQLSERVLKVLQAGVIDDRDVNASGSSAE